MNTEQERALLPCPFCGGVPNITKQMGESLWSHDIVLWTQVQCDGCEAHVGPTCEGFEVEAVDIWNRRAALQSQDRARLQFLAYEGCSINSRKQTDGSLEYQLYWEQVMKWQDEWFDSPEEAIDHARRVEGDGG